MSSHFKEPVNKHSRHQHVKKMSKWCQQDFNQLSNMITFGRPESSKDFYHIQAGNETGLTIGIGSWVILGVIKNKNKKKQLFASNEQDKDISAKHEKKNIKSFFKVCSHAPAWQNNLQGKQLQFT